MHWTHRGDSHCGFVAPLAADDSAQLLAIPRKQRAEVRKGFDNDLEVTVGDGPADRAAHHAVYAESVRNLGTPVFPRKLFDAALDQLDASVLTVRHRGAPVASVLSFYHRDRVLPYWGGGTFAARHLRANDRMYFELMCHARRQGCERFDFGRSKTGSGAWFFKKNWGFEPEPLSYSSWTAPGAERRDADPTSARHAARIALWKRLPLALANRLGPPIARGLGVSGYPVPRPPGTVPARSRRQDPLAPRAQGAGRARAGPRRLLRRDRGGQGVRGQSWRRLPRAIACRPAANRCRWPGSRPWRGASRSASPRPATGDWTSGSPAR